MSQHNFLDPVSHDNSAVESVKISADQFESILNIQQKILDSIAQDCKESDILDLLCTLSETLLENSAASIMLLDEKTHKLRLVSAPSIPQEAKKRLDNTIPGKQNGSCASAIYYGRPSYVIDTSCDIRWNKNRELADNLSICSCWSIPVRNRDGNVIGTFALGSFEHRSPTTFHDRLLKMCASAVSILFERKALRELAMLDKLTKLWNRTKLDRMLEQEHAQMDATNHNYAIMLIDIDFFKAVNDNYGHNTGDTVLVELADIMREQVVEGGIVGRWGGEEFMVILNKQNSNKAAEIAHQIREAVQNHHFETIGSLTVSVGVCIVTKQTATLEVIDAADQALYQAKKSGRNRVSVRMKNQATQLPMSHELQTISA